MHPPQIEFSEKISKKLRRKIASILVASELLCFVTGIENLPKGDLYVGCLLSFCFEQSFQAILRYSGSRFSSPNIFPLKMKFSTGLILFTLDVFASSVLFWSFPHCQMTSQTLKNDTQC